jgi:hypothetical protein
MSVTDAKETISQGVSLKERMVTFQRKGSPDPAILPPKPATKKPSIFGPPMKLVNHPTPSEERLSFDFKTVARSPPLNTESTGTPIKNPMKSVEQVDEEVKKVSEEEESQRRVEDDSRTKQLDGVKIRKAPPVAPQKPPFRRPTIPKEQTNLGAVCV